MKKIILVLVLLITYYVSHITFAQAHVLETDGTIGAVVHIDPDDDPIVGKPAHFFFEFKDTQHAFTPVACECTVHILKEGAEIYTTGLFQNNADPSLTNASFSYTFAEKNIYTVKIVGKPTQVHAFQPFTLDYDLRVSRESKKNAADIHNTEQSFPIVAVVIGGLLIFFAALFLIKKRNQTHVLLLIIFIFLTFYVYPAHLTLAHHHNPQTAHEYYPCTAAYTSDRVTTFTLLPSSTFSVQLHTAGINSCDQVSFDTIRIRSPPDIS